MPMRWDAAADQLMLLQILDTHKITLNYQVIAASWPKDSRHGSPTPRAIAERIVRLRKSVASSRRTVKGGEGRGMRSMCPSPTPTKVENMEKWAAMDMDTDDEVPTAVKKDKEEKADDEKGKADEAAQVPVKQEDFEY